MTAEAAAAQAGRLLALYRGAHYAARLPGGRRCVLVVDTPLPSALGPWCVGAACMLITACNPRSQRLPARENHARLRRLCADVSAAGARLLPAVGRGSDWREASLLVTGLPIGTIDALAQRYGQNAVLHAAPGQPVRLRLYRADGWNSGEKNLEMAP